MALRPVSDVTAGDWLSAAEPTLGPPGFEAYVRVLHPWTGRDGGDDDRVEGHLPDDELAALVEVLARHTRTPDVCFHAPLGRLRRAGRR